MSDRVLDPGQHKNSMPPECIQIQALCHAAFQPAQQHMGDISREAQGLSNGKLSTTHQSGPGHAAQLAALEG